MICSGSNPFVGSYNNTLMMNNTLCMTYTLSKTLEQNLIFLFKTLDTDKYQQYSQSKL